MKQSTIIWIVIIIVILAAGVWLMHGDEGREGNRQIANPASVNCVQTLGGTLAIVDEANGQVGYCHLPDGRVCEEWALYQNQTCVPPTGTATSTSATTTAPAVGATTTPSATTTAS